MIKKLSKTLKEKHISQFTAISAAPKTIKEKVLLKISDVPESIDISYTHTPLCLQPLIIGILTQDLLIINDSKRAELWIVRSEVTNNENSSAQNKIMATIRLKYFNTLEIKKNTNVIFFNVEKSSLLQSTKIETLKYIWSLYLHFLKAQKRNSFSFLNNLAALYSFPRKVILNIIKTDAHFNIFPMDLVSELPGEDILILGLNINNRSVDEIIRTKKMIIVEPIPDSKEMVYGFAGNHRKKMIESDFADKYKTNSEMYCFPVPDFVRSYKEISLIKYLKLGSHYILVCKIENQKIIDSEKDLLYHISTIHHLYLKRQNDFYSVV